MLPSSICPPTPCFSSPYRQFASARAKPFSAGLPAQQDVQKALRSIDERASAIVDEWVKDVEIPAPPPRSRERAKYKRA